ncbi:MAG: hypothetical protein ACN6NT_01475 [Comamonas sp.]
MERRNQPSTNAGLRQFLAHIVPVVVDIMMTHPEAVWGEACYRVVE